MGYYTEHKLFISKGSFWLDINQDVIDYMMQEDEDTDWRWNLMEFNGMDTVTPTSCDSVYFRQEPCTWYDHRDDMRRLSKRFPNVVFILEGNGEGDDDYWREYWLDGKCQYCPAEVTIVYEEFDKDKLKEVF